MPKPEPPDFTLHDVEAVCGEKGCGVVHICKSLKTQDQLEKPYFRICDRCADAKWKKTEAVTKEAAERRHVTGVPKYVPPVDIPKQRPRYIAGQDPDA